MNKTFIPFKELRANLLLILRPESNFYIISIVYSIGVSVLSLAIPISVQSLVNTVTFGVLIQPLIVLSILLLSLLLFSGILNALQSYMIELFERHFYARTTSDITIKLLNSDESKIRNQNNVELVNRYFDVMSVQKSLSTLLTGGVTMILQTIVGLLLLAFYHPYFIIFDVILLVCVWFVWKAFGNQALSTVVNESYAKYDVASWLEEIARTKTFFKTRRRKKEALKVSDSKIVDYIKARTEHFRQVFFQTISLLSIYAIMSALLLGMGGFLVIEGQLTLGQLVAAELIVTVILAGFSKSEKYLEAFYDLYAASDKLSLFYKIPSNTSSSDKLPELNNYDLKLNHAQVGSNDSPYIYDYTFETGKNYFIYSKFFSSKVNLINLLTCIDKPVKGQLLFGGVPFEQISYLDIRDNVYVVDRPYVFEGSLWDNIVVGNENIPRADIIELLSMVELDQLMSYLPEGLDTKILPTGYPLWKSQLIRLEIVRAIIHNPKILVLTEEFDQLERSRRTKILKYIIGLGITVINFSAKPNRELKYDKYLYLNRTDIVEYDSCEDLLKENEGSNA